MIAQAETHCCPNCGSTRLRWFNATRSGQPWFACQSCHEKYKGATYCPTPSEIERVAGQIRTGEIVVIQRP